MSQASNMSWEFQAVRSNRSPGLAYYGNLTKRQTWKHIFRASAEVTAIQSRKAHDK